MVEQSIIAAVKSYISAVKSCGLPVEKAVVFGSQAEGRATGWSDIDLLVVSPAFDGLTDRNGLNLLWRIAGRVDNRIEPIPCGSKQWLLDDSSAIIEIARRHGQIVVPD